MATQDQKFKELAKRLRDDGPNANIDDLINMTGNNLENSRQSRDLLDQYVGNEMMKNSGKSVDMGTDKDIIKTLTGLTEEYSDVKKPMWRLNDSLDNVGAYDPNDKMLEASRKYVKGKEGLYTAGGLIAHEPIHQMVDEAGGVSVKDKVMSEMKKNLMKESGINGGIDLAKRGALTGHEIMQAGHLNPDSRTTSSLKNAIAAATGKFGKLMKSVPLVGPLAAGGLTYALTGDAEAAQQAGVPLLNEADIAGPRYGSLEEDFQNPNKSSDQRANAAEQLRIEQNIPKENLGKISDDRMERKGQLIDNLGPLEGSFGSDIEDPSKSYEQRIKAIQQLSQRRD